jgi:hypothetical protein
MPPPVTWLQYPAVWPQELTFKEVGCSCTIFLVTWDPIPSSVNAQGSTDHQVLGLDAIDMPPRGGIHPQLHQHHRAAEGEEVAAQRPGTASDYAPTGLYLQWRRQLSES